MILTTKGRYAVMALVDISMYSKDKPVTLANISERQEIDISYLEQIFAKLKKAGIVKAVRGPGGGYLLNKNQTFISISDIMLAVHENFKITRCNEKNSGGCTTQKTRCVAHHLWENLQNQIYFFLQKTSLADVCNNSFKLNNF
jgi:Rrf2 family iron-sulfur cluster assembly transcriptional regulator